MSHTWNFSHQRQEQVVVEEEEENKYPRSHVHNQQNQSHLDTMSDKCEVAELTWENGQLAMQRLGSSLPNEQAKHKWKRAGDTLESFVQQATFQKQNSNGHNQENINMDKNAYSCGEWGETSSALKQQTRGVLKRMRSDSDPQLYDGGEFSKNMIDHQHAELSARDNIDTTMMTWPCSFDESSRSFKSKAACNENSACHGGLEYKEEERETKSSNPLKRSRRAAVHNQSERRRRDRINEKMKALQKLVPTASKTDKASMLEEVIKYLKQLQAQIQLISYSRSYMEQQMMMMQPHIQMQLLERMGGLNLGMGTGMLNNMTANLARSPYQSLTSPLIYPTSSIATPCPPFLSPAFAMAPSNIPTPPQANGDATRAAAAPNSTSSFPFNDPYSAFLPQSMKMEFNNEMAAQYLQQVNQAMQTTRNLNQENVNIQGQKR
ncbi:hypothetical protein K7X08_022418 [Anisodus acutangulus]|uniref:BHLH domain-containing protein n=1 Tax=Anisodus acutangulus TaxID=402998 RepID=A0A9Q1MHZ2_9SOLA|nr:hypothetical protein K7X08_022418 [Anisodus acutangulus]